MRRCGLNVTGRDKKLCEAAGVRFAIVSRVVCQGKTAEEHLSLKFSKDTEKHREIEDIF